MNQPSDPNPENDPVRQIREWESYIPLAISCAVLGIFPGLGVPLVMAAIVFAFISLNRIHDDPTIPGKPAALIALLVGMLEVPYQLWCLGHMLHQIRMLP
ncbi:hypothetical protein [Bremerella sp.]|uniref:hypothetical protein n=1 Tax=Bremerella sp. TaxID=2795602 RepID=UPI0039195E1C